MSLDLLELGSLPKPEAIEATREYIDIKNLRIVKEDLERPWGFFFYIDPAQAEEFKTHFFDGKSLQGIDEGLPLQPKVLVFAPGQENSWQYHDRRSEIWRILSRLAQVKMSKNDTEPNRQVLHFGQIINFEQGVRHRGGAMSSEWSAAAEIWQHTDPHNLSDENDIHRLQDNYGRQ